MSVVGLTNVLAGQLAVEGFLRGEAWLCKPFPGVHILVRVDALAQQEIAPFSAWLELGCNLECLGLVGGHQLVQGGQQELGAVDEPELPERERDVLLRVVGDAGDPALYLRDGLHQQVRVIPPQVVEDDWYGRSFGAKPQLQVADVVCGTSVGDMAVVADSIPLKWLLTHVTGGGSIEGLPVLGGHPHGLGVGQHRLDLSFHILNRF